MIVIDINSGLGNQMLAYCVVLAMQKTNPQNPCYIETIIYDIPECDQIVSQWNGYELDRIFGIATPNVRTLFTEQQWKNIMSEVRQSFFWEKKMDYPLAFTNAFNHAGLHLINKKGSYEDPNSQVYKEDASWLKKFKSTILNKTIIGAYVKNLYRKKNEEKLKYSCSHPERLFLKTDEDIFTGMWLDFKYNGNYIERIHDDIMQTFVFPSFVTEKNQKFAEMLDSCNSVFIHARRGDMLSVNGWCYKYGYFRRAVKHIRRNVKDPVFIFFTNTGSIQWCKENARVFGLDFKKDKVFFVDWNIGTESFRDMQLMSHCKHGIITNSTFGWWGAYMIKNPQKITISPLAELNTTYHC